MYLSYFAADSFPFPQGSSDGPYTTFPGTPGLGYYRPNQALNRVYSTRAALSGLGSLRGLGDASGGGTDTTTLLLIAGGIAAAAALGLFGKKKLRRFRAGRLRRRVRRTTARIHALEA